MRKQLVAGMVCALCAAAAMAFPTGMQPAADGTRLTLTGEAQAVVDNDEGAVYFNVVRTGPQLADVTREVIEAVNKGLEGLRGSFTDATFQTQSFTSQPKYDKGNKKIVAWEVRQSISAKLPAFQAAALVHDLAAAGFAFENVSFHLSFKAEQSVQRDLSREVVEAAAAKAEAIALTMGMTAADVTMESVDLSSRNSSVPRPVLMAASLRSNAANDGEAMPIPTFDRGRTTLSLSGVAAFRIKRQLAGVAPASEAAAPAPSTSNTQQ